jgi:Ca2+-binding RTX toxin-like protein
MSFIEFDALNAGQYDNYRFKIMSDVWGANKNAYLDSGKVPSIGTDIDLTVSFGDLQTVAETILGPVDRTTMAALWTAVNGTYATNAKLRTALDKVLSDHGFSGHFAFSTLLQMRTALDGISTTSTVESSLNISDVDMPSSEERAAVFSVAYEGVDVTSILDAILLKGDRFQAWYDIRYDSNHDSEATSAELHATATRRYIQSDYFELYNDPGNVSYDEAYDVGRGYQVHRNQILSYEHRYAATEAGQSAKALTSGGIGEQLQPAIASILVHFGISAGHLDEVLFATHSKPNLNGDGTSFDSKANDDDLLIGSTENNTLAGNQGNDVLIGLGGNDRLEGDNGRDRLYGYSGNDTLVGGADDDRLAGGRGNDRLDGGSGNDLLSGSIGKDRIDGGAGNDTLRGGNDDDVLAGASGRDNLDAGYGNDTLTGDAGNDHLDGGVGNDRIDGGDDDDWLYGNAGKDRLTGSAGNDTLIGGNDADALIAGVGNDRLDGGFGNDTLSGGGGRDSLSGGDGNDDVDGGSGNDVLRGGNGNDHLIGGKGNDRLDGGAGRDRLEGGSGNDIYVLGGNKTENTHPDPVPKPDTAPGPDPVVDPNPSTLLGGNSADAISVADMVVEARNGGTDTALIVGAGTFNLHNVERMQISGQISGNVSLMLNEFGSFKLSNHADQLEITINKLQKQAIDITTGAGNDTVRIDLAPGIDPSQVLNHKGLTARFDFSDISAGDTIDLSSIGIRKVVAHDLDITTDKGYYLLAPDAVLHLMDGADETKTYTNDTNSWFVVKCGDATPYGPEFIGHLTVGNFDI